MRIDIWSDIVCPWCYIGKRRFEQAVARFDHRDKLQVAHRAFMLNPQLAPGETVDREQMLMRKYHLTPEQVHTMHERLEQTAAADGLEYHLSGGVSGNSVHAHRLVHFAREHGRDDAMLERLYRAYFTERRSVFDVESLSTLAGEAGLDVTDARQTLSGTRFSEAVDADVNQARAFGASGVPFFVFAQRYYLSGAQPVDTFLDALNRSWSETHAFQKRQ